MKQYYAGEIKRDKDGKFWVDDTKIDWTPMYEVPLSIYMGSLLGTLIEHWRLNNITGSIIIDVKIDCETRKEASND